MVENPALDQAFRALADPTRRAILSRLAELGPATVTQLAEPFDISLAAVSKHIGVLERASLVSREKLGRTHTLRIDPRPLESASAWLDHSAQFWTNRLDALETFLKESADKDQS